MELYRSWFPVDKKRKVSSVPVIFEFLLLMHNLSISNLLGSHFESLRFCVCQSSRHLKLNYQLVLHSVNKSSDLSDTG